MSPFKLAAFGTTALLCGTALASASVITESESFGYTKTNWGTSTQTFNFTPDHPLKFKGFDALVTGGSLKSVTIELIGALMATVTLENDGNTATAVQATMANYDEVLLPGVPPTNGHKYSARVVAGGPGSSATVTDNALGAHDSFGPKAVSASTSADFSITKHSVLADYLNPWTAQAGDLATITISSGNGNGTASYTNVGKIILEVAYNFTGGHPVPEPMSAALLGAGLVGTGILRRRRKA